MKINSTDINFRAYQPNRSLPEVSSENTFDCSETIRNEHSDSPTLKKEEISEDVLAKAIESANRAIGNMHAEVKFSIHEGTRDICIKIIDKRNNEVIREIPPEKLLDLVAKLWELAGIFVDEKR